MINVGLGITSPAGLKGKRVPSLPSGWFEADLAAPYSGGEVQIIDASGDEVETFTISGSPTQNTEGIVFDGTDDYLQASLGSGLDFTDTACNFFIVLKTTNVKNFLLSDVAGVSGNWDIGCQDANAGGPSNTGGTIHVDDSASLADRDAVHTAVADGNYHYIESRGGDFSAWANLVVAGRTSFIFDGTIALIYFKFSNVAAGSLERAVIHSRATVKALDRGIILP